MAWAPGLLAPSGRGATGSSLDFLLFYLAPNLAALVYPSVQPELDDWRAAAELLFRLHEAHDVLVWQTSQRSGAVPVDVLRHRVVVAAAAHLPHVLPLAALFRTVAAIRAHQEEKPGHVGVVPTQCHEGRNVLLLVCTLAALGRYAGAQLALAKLQQRAAAATLRLSAAAPSLRRYAGYFDRCLAARCSPDRARTLHLKQLLFFDLLFPALVAVHLVDGDATVRVFRSSTTDDPQPGWRSVDVPDDVPLTGDVRVTCCCLMAGGSTPVFEFCFHSMFVSATGLALPVDELDRCPASRDLLPPSFAVNLVFDASKSTDPPALPDRAFLATIRHFASDRAHQQHEAKPSSSAAAATPVSLLRSSSSSSSPVSRQQAAASKSPLPQRRPPSGQVKAPPPSLCIAVNNPLDLNSTIKFSIIEFITTIKFTTIKSSIIEFITTTKFTIIKFTTNKSSIIESITTIKFTIINFIIANDCRFINSSIKFEQ